MSKLDRMSLSEYLFELMRVADGNKQTPLDTASNPIELNWDWYNWCGYIGESRYTEAHLALCKLGYTFDNYKE